jgi:microsomal dipeptidase-like Zn-dependent dipeptidase/gamma-glutamyl-gamma-aminobutyrate hydrolase PuuD
MQFSIERLYKTIDDITSDGLNNRPLIGISSNKKDGTSCIADSYFQSVVLAGGAPVLVPVTTDIKSLEAVVKSLDGLILSGGGDIDPFFLGEEEIPELDGVDRYRDEYDLTLLRIAFNHQLPVFGICRGHQLINVAFGGTLYQDIHTRFSKDALSHSQKEPREQASHKVRLVNMDSILKRVFSNTDEVNVNSLHHQAVKDIASGFVETAVATDDLNEGIEHVEYPVWSVQWHPEAMAAPGDETMLRLFEYHVRQCSVFSKAKTLHRKILTVDSHTDTPMIFESFDLGKKEGGKVNLPLMEEGLLDAAFMVAYIPQGERDEQSLQKAYDYAVERLGRVIEQSRIHSRRMGIARNVDDLKSLKAENRKAIFLGIENGYAIGKDILRLGNFKNMGVSYITLCHNGDNDICDSAKGNAEWGGLSPFGIDVVREMNRLGMMIDVSHAAESAFYDVLKYSSKPVIASHSSVRALCDHPRNLYDDQIRALAANGGVVQICLYKGFINEDAEKASVSDAIRHICHVVDLAGIDYVGIGSDFDGDGGLTGCRAANELLQITMRLIAEGFNDEDIAKIWGGNLLSVNSKNASSLP